MIDLRFDYRGGTICIVSPSEHDEIARSIQQRRTFYEFDVLERCEWYLATLRRHGGTILDIGAFTGNHTVFFASFCQASEVLAFEPCRASFAMLEQTILRNQLKNTRAFNVAIAEKSGFGSITVRDAANLGANRLQSCDAAASDAVPVADLDAFLKSIGAGNESIVLVKIDVEGMETEVLTGAQETLRRSRPVLCIEILDAQHMRRVSGIFGRLRYLIRECNGAAPTYIATYEVRPAFLVRLLNLGWLVLAYCGTNAWRWRYRRLLEILFPPRVLQNN